MPVQLYQTEWERRKIRNRVHLTMGEGACLGPCPLANVVMLIFDGAAVWLQNMHTDAQVMALYDYIEAMIAANAYLPPPASLTPYAFQAYDWQTQTAKPIAPLPVSPAPVQIRPAAADFVFLTHADTDLLILDKAKALLPAEFANIRGFNAAEFDSRSKVDAFILDQVSEVKIVLARLLTLDETLLSQLHDHCVEYGKALLLVSGTDVPDIGLAKFSTVSPAVQTDTLGYFRAGGADNLAQLLRFLSDHLLATGLGYEPPIAQAQLGLAKPFVKSQDPNCRTVGILFYRAYHLSGNMAFVDALVREIEAQGAQALPIYVPATKDANLAALGLEGVADVFISTLANAGLWRDSDAKSSAKGGAEGEPAGMIGDCVVIQAPMSSSTRAQWEASMRGLNPRDTITTVVLPEFDGAVIGPPIGFKQDHTLTFEVAPDRIRRVVGIALKWAALRHKPNAEKRIAFVLTNSSAKAAKIGNAVGLDSPASLTRLLNHMQQAGYSTGDWEQAVREWDASSTESSGEKSPDPQKSLSDALIHMLIARGSYDKEFLADFQLEQAIGSVGKNDYARWHSELSQLQKQQVDGRWGEPPGGAFHHQGKLVFAGLQFEHVFIGLQPPRGYGMDPRLIYHTPDLPPTHHYHAFYAWLAKPQAEGGWGADAIVHMGKHGTLEWLPGKSLGLSQHCYPDTFLADVPLIYPFILNDPGEGMQAKRRAHAVIVDHLTPPLTNAELYDDLNELLQLVDEYYQLEATDPSKLPTLQRQIWALMKKTHLDDDLRRISQKQAELHGHTWDLYETDEGVPITIVEMQGVDFSHMLEDIQGYLCELHGAQIRDGLHTLGEIPTGEALVDLLFALTRLPNLNIPSLRDSVAAGLGVSPDDKRAMLAVDARCRELIRDALLPTPNPSQLGGEFCPPPSWEGLGVGK
ncbi:MAG: cobaltochelatase subunit CobN, partial [Anaerolineae bacterium]|nr:cobaltochelatase subunit CobN [Anaerolineae bacterium]